MYIISPDLANSLKSPFYQNWESMLSTMQPARGTILYMECASHKKTLSFLWNDRTVAISEEKVNFSGNHQLRTCINSYIWYERNGVSHCTMPTSVQRTAIWPVFRVPGLFSHLIRRMLGILPGELFDTEDTSEEKVLAKPNPSYLFSKNEVHCSSNPGFAHQYFP